MKSNHITIALALFSAMLVQNTKAQETKRVSSEDAHELSEKVVGHTGFREAYFSKDDMQKLLSEPKATSVRFYIGRQSDGQYYTDLIAVGLDSAGREMDTYIYCKSKDEDPKMRSAQKDRKYCQACVNNLGFSFMPYASEFSKEDIIELLLQSGTTGIRVLSAGQFAGKYEVEKSMSIGSVKVDSGKLVETGKTYLQALEPCPAHCGGSGGKYLFDASRWAK